MPAVLLTHRPKPSSGIIDERVTMTAKLLAEEIIKSLMGASTISS